MKKYLILIIALIFLQVGNVSSEENKTFDGNGDTLIVKSICLDGHLFAVASSKNGVSIVQVFRKWNNFGNPPVPIVCK